MYPITPINTTSYPSSIKDTTLCENCHQEFATHNYVAGRWLCPFEVHTDMAFGRPHTNDPNQFLPDPELCSIEELEEYKRIREFYNRFGRIPHDAGSVGYGITTLTTLTEFVPHETNDRPDHSSLIV